MRNVALIGMAGVGKTSVGKIVARKLGMAFCDTDELVEQKSGMTVSEIFAAWGEERFRALETEAVGEAARMAGVVISCGGGAVLRDENVKLLQGGNCLTVYLKARADTLTRHVGKAESRPLLCGDTENKIKKLLAERESIYKSAADIVVGADDATADEIAERVLSKILYDKEVMSHKNGTNEA